MGAAQSAFVLTLCYASENSKNTCTLRGLHVRCSQHNVRDAMQRNLINQLLLFHLRRTQYAAYGEKTRHEASMTK